MPIDTIHAYHIRYHIKHTCTLIIFSYIHSYALRVTTIYSSKTLLNYVIVYSSIILYALASTDSLINAISPNIDHVTTSVH